MIHYAIQYDGMNFYILDDGPTRPTVNELIDVYLQQKTKLPIKLGKVENKNTYSASGTKDNQTSASISGSSGTDVLDGPKVPEKPSSFLFLKRPVSSVEGLC